MNLKIKKQYKLKNNSVIASNKNEVFCSIVKLTSLGNVKKKILMGFGLTLLFAINNVIGQTNVTTKEGGTTDFIPKWESSTSITNSNIYSAPNKNIGIGTNNPQTTLHIFNTNLSLPTTIRIQSGDDVITPASFTDLVNTNTDFIIKRQNVDVFTINSTTANINEQVVVNGNTIINGNIGVGTPTPLQKLHIESGSVLINNNTTSTPDLTIKRTIVGSKPSINLISTWHDNETNTYHNGKFDIQIDGQYAKFMVTAGWTPQTVEIMSFTDGGSSINGALNVVNNLTVHGTSNLVGNITVGANLTINGLSNLKGNVTIGTASVPANLTVNGNTSYNGNFSLGTTTATEKLNVKGNILIESQTSINGGAFKFENVTEPGPQGTFYDMLKIYYNNYPTSYIGIGKGSLLLIKKGLSIREGEIVIDDANLNRTIYIHQDGRIWAKKLLLADAEQWPDYVFEDNYNLQSLPELENYLKINKHLPNMPTANEIKDKGMDVGAINTELLKKVEELTLYLIEQNKQNETQQKQIEELMKIVNK